MQRVGFMRTALVSLFALLAVACASHTAEPPTLTAAVVGPRFAPTAPVDDALSDAIGASLAGEDERALALLDRETRESPWRDYARGVALAGLHSTDDAAHAFDAAARAFPSDDVRHRAMAIWGKARAYHDAHRCADAIAAYDEYAALVRSSDPDSAAMAERYSRDCASFHLH